MHRASCGYDNASGATLRNVRSGWIWWSVKIVVAGETLVCDEQLKEIPRGPSLPTSRNRSRKSQNLMMEPWVQETWSSTTGEEGVGMIWEASRKTPEVLFSQGRVPRMGINQATRAWSGRENVRYGAMKTGSVFSNGFPLGGDGEGEKGEG